MTLPPKNKRVLAWVDGEQYPFVGYFDEVEGWCMEVEYLNCDTHRNDIFGEVVAWQELPSRPTPLAPDTATPSDNATVLHK